MNYAVRDALAAVALLSAGAAPAAAGPSEDAFAAFLRGDYATALQLLEPLATQGVPQAQYYLGLMYDVGHAVPQDYAKAMKWYRVAAAQGIAPAQFNLGLMYETGQGVPQDYMQAYMWLDLCATRGAKEHRDEAAKVRDRLAARMTPAEVTEAQHRAREWKPGAP